MAASRLDMFWAEATDVNAATESPTKSARESLFAYLMTQLQLLRRFSRRAICRAQCRAAAFDCAPGRSSRRRGQSMERDLYLPRATLSRSGPSGLAKPRSPVPPCRRQSNASQDHIEDVRRRSRLRSRQADRTQTVAAVRPAHGNRSCRSAYRRTSQRGQAKRVVKFAIGEQSGIGVTKKPRNCSDRRQNRAEEHPNLTHPPGSPSPPPTIPDKLLIAISESRRPLRKSVRHPANAG